MASVEFRIDGELSGPAVVKPPYAVSVNTWRYGNGNHTIEVTGYDVFGNHASAKHSVSVKNTGSAPAVPDRVVYDDASAPHSSTAHGGRTWISQAAPLCAAVRPRRR